MSWLSDVNQKLETFKNTISTSQIDIPTVFVPTETFPPPLAKRYPKFRKPLPGAFPMDEEQITWENDERDDTILDGIIVQDVSDDGYPLLLPITRKISATTSERREIEKEGKSEGDELDIINQYAESRSSDGTLLPVHPYRSEHTIQHDLRNTSNAYDPLSSSSTLAPNDDIHHSEYLTFVEQEANDSRSDNTNWSIRPVYSSSNPSLASDISSLELERQEDSEVVKVNPPRSFPTYYSFSYKLPSKPASSNFINLNKPLPPPPVPDSPPSNPPYLDSPPVTPSPSPLSRFHKAKARVLNLRKQEKVAKKVDMTPFFGDDTRSRKRMFDRGVPWGFHGRDYQPPLLKEHCLAETMRDKKVRKRGIMERGGILERGKFFVRRWGERLWDFVV